MDFYDVGILARMNTGLRHHVHNALDRLVPLFRGNLSQDEYWIATFFAISFCHLKRKFQGGNLSQDEYWIATL